MAVDTSDTLRLDEIVMSWLSSAWFCSFLIHISPDATMAGFIFWSSLVYAALPNSTKDSGGGGGMDHWAWVLLYFELFTF
jgi:hypothetical protein